MQIRALYSVNVCVNAGVNVVNVNVSIVVSVIFYLS